MYHFNIFFTQSLSFLSHCSVGGSLPVAFSYFCEFFSKKNRGPFVIILAGFWTLGSVFAAVTALSIIEHTDIMLPFGEHFEVYVHSGRGRGGWWGEKE